MTEAEITALRLAAESPVSATQADCDAVARDLSASFSQDPLFDWFLRDDARREPARLARSKKPANAGFLPCRRATRNQILPNLDFAALTQAAFASPARLSHFSVATL